MAERPPHLDVSRRERQILDVLFARGRATAAEIQRALPDAPSYSAVRALLRILETKGLIRHEQDGPRYAYVSVIPKDRARHSALRHLVRTFFDGSTEQAVAALLDGASTDLSDAELDRLARLIDERKRQR
ncbi:MAG TPA: BlaI/MecI/CopY family transcriptional regulator [Vicinamibacterales bacterium]